MKNTISKTTLYQRKYKISGLFFLLIILMGIFLVSILKTISMQRKVPSATTKVSDLSFRGSIYSSDNYTLSKSQKTYQAVIRGSSIVPEKKVLFIKLFSIYSGISENKILNKIHKKNGKLHQGNIILSKNINTKHAMQLKSLAYKLRQLNVFQSIKNKNGIEILYGLDIIANGEKRCFPLHDVLSPIVGYVGKIRDGKYIHPEGRKGLERHYEKYISAKENGFLKGKRDVSGTIIHDKNTIQKIRVDGMDLHLNISLSFQRRVEMMIDMMKEKIDAQEIIVGVMESNTGKLLSLASTERYDPSHIQQKDIPALVPKFTEYPYEAGSVLKPISLAIALDHHVVTPNSVFNTYNGRLQIGKRHWITDDEKFDSLTATDIIVHSSNVGISQISWKLTGKEFRKGLLDFGIAKPSGIDLSRDLPGQLKSAHILEHPLHRANSSYGYGMLVTFAQLFKAYSAFNNDGIAVTPRIVNYLEDAKGRHYILEPKYGNVQAISKKSANEIHSILKEVVKRGTGVKAQYPGLEIGGKTGTAHIAKHGRYVHEYHSSFYGFANDDHGHKYTIGVLVIRAKKYHKYFASQSAVPTFKNLTRILVDQGYLKVNQKEILKNTKNDPLYAEEISNIKTEVSIPPNKPEEVKKSPKQPKTVKELFEIKEKPKKRKISHEKNSALIPIKEKPSPKKSPHELFEDLF